MKIFAKQCFFFPSAIFRCKALILTCLLVWQVTDGRSQPGGDPGRRFGVKGGLSVSTFMLSGDYDAQFRAGWHGGFFARFPLLAGFSIQPELLYNSKGSSVSFNNSNNTLGYRKASYVLDYVDLPVLVHYNFVDYFNIHLGHYASYLIRQDLVDVQTYNGNSALVIRRSDYNDFDFGLAAGFGFDFPHFILGARYNLGIMDVSNKDAVIFTKNARNSSFQLYAGVNF